MCVDNLVIWFKKIMKSLELKNIYFSVSFPRMQEFIFFLIFFRKNNNYSIILI